MPEMTLLRKTDLSLYYYLKHVVLCSFIEKEEGIELDLVEEISSTTSFVYTALTDMIPIPTERGRGWVYVDSGSTTDDACTGFYSTISGTRFDGEQINGLSEQNSRITVYDTTSTGVIPDNEYMIDYIDGRIITSGTVSPAYVDYYWYYVSIVDEWAAIEASDSPVVVIDIHGTDKNGYQLGAGKKIVRKVDLHIFGDSTAERNDLVEVLYDGLYLKSAPLLSFPLGTALDYDGTWYGRRDNMNKLETLFDTERESGIIGNMKFENITARHVNLPILMTRSRDEVMLSDLNAYRSKISFDLVIYTDGTTYN
jgi:hypothetical protein